MRPLEILLAISIAAAIALSYLLPTSISQGAGTKRPNAGGYAHIIGLGIAGMALLQLAVEGYRWQMIPLYVLAGVVGLAYLRLYIKPTGPVQQPRPIRVVIFLAGLLALGLAIALPALLPVPRLPQPTGPYPLGTFSLELTDPVRKELYSGNPDEPRRVMLQLWYPASAVAQTELAPWLERMDIMGPAIAAELGLPAFFLDHIALVHTNSLLNAPLAETGGPFPVLLFSHGWTGFRSQNTYQMEELASHGYVVAALQHPYGASATVFPDGQVTFVNPQAMQSGASREVHEAVANILIDQWAGDLGLALDLLAEFQRSDPQGRLTGRLDLEKVGVFGHSTGGGAAIEFCARDPRCKAVLGLDAFMAPISKSVLDTGLDQPALFLFSELWPSERNNELFERLYRRQRAPAWAYTLLGADHYDFTDLPMLSPLANRLGLKGPIPGKRALRIINDYSLAFFDWAFSATLDSQESPQALFSEENASYPEIRTR